jgi:hypothetical protein
MQPYEALPELLTSLTAVAAQAVTEAMTQDAVKAHIPEEERDKVLEVAAAITRNGSRKSPVS